METISVLVATGIFLVWSLLENSVTSAVLVFIFGFLAIKYMSNEKFAEKMDRYF